MNTDKKAVKKRSALGRGLGALLEDSVEVQNNTPESEIGVVNVMREIPIEQIETNPYQPRTHFDREALEELAESIRQQGLIQPVTVRQLSRNQFQLISGERRLQASRQAGLTTMPAYIRTANDTQMLEMALIENIQRENLNALEIAHSYQRLISECDLKQEELGERVGKKRSTVNNYLRLLKLPAEIQASIRDNLLSMGHARAIINIDNIETQLAIYRRILNEELSVRKVEELVRELATGSPDTKEKKDKESAPLSPVLQDLQNKLTSHFGTRVQIRTNERSKGEIKIPFMSDDDLNRILELLSL
ncbi:chromosome partitioning protein, ParB family [Catalinimonas alkaloidigena]|uniref:Chromosome partitioning protein, ParB family n=1 Tax=Catalinimonas alkaloidigena TaxID=1075417 RepID=A0A1G8XUY6_9BACT|nr:ParB/RepB/Spo0J family partition protein [Catalinimonas alkaloidigena]SDJ94323.1 chromosome partitioning protein, ParB family [Catalinimonas alkaloidigena]